MTINTEGEKKKTKNATKLEEEATFIPLCFPLTFPPSSPPFLFAPFFSSIRVSLSYLRGSGHKYEQGRKNSCLCGAYILSVH